MLTYRSATPSYWACFLLPVAIYFADIKFNGESFIALSIILSNTLLLIIFHALQFQIQSLLSGLKRFNLFMSLVTLGFCVLVGGNYYEYASYTALNFTFPFMFYNLIKRNPKSFTFAEGIIATSAFCYNFWLSSQNLPFPPESLKHAPEAITISIFVQTLFFAGILAARFVLLAVQPWKLFELEELYCLWAKCCLVAFSYRLKDTSTDVWYLMKWPFTFLFGSKERVFIFGYWAVCLIVAIIFVAIKNIRRSQATTIERKYFHFLIAAVYIPGLLKDFELIYFCSIVVLFVFVVFEIVRVLRFEILGLKIGDFIDDQVRIYRDHQDEGNLILTPIYLLAGCSMPIWLTGLFSKDLTILEPIEIAASLTGVLSIGIGDTCSSIGGTLLGRTRWQGTNKTLEGTACCIVSQLGMMTVVILIGWLPYNMISVIGLVIAIVINSLAEAKTDQIDNLIVPLVSFNSIHAFKFVVEWLRYSSL